VAFGQVSACADTVSREGDADPDRTGGCASAEADAWPKAIQPRIHSLGAVRRHRVDVKLFTALRQYVTSASRSLNPLSSPTGITLVPLVQ
jgi:hypothetical protein